MPEPSQTQTPKNSRETRQKGLFHRPALWWREWAKPFLLNYQWLIIGAFLLGAAVLGFLAVHTNNPNSSWQNKLYDTVQIFTMNSSLGDDQYRRSHALALAQVCAVLFFLTFSGKVVWLVFRDQLQLLRLRFWYWFRKDYIIICGLGRLGRGLALGLLSKGQRVIVIELYEHNNYIQEIRDRGGIVLIGDGSKETVLQTAMVTGANRIICSAGDDGLNSDIAATATNLVKYVNRKVPLICNVHIADPGTMELLRERELNAEEVPQIRLQFFSRFDRRAKELIEEYWEELLRHPTVTKSAPTLTICGAGFLSQCLAIQAVRRWDSDPPRPASKVKVRVVGPGAKSMVERLFERYQGIEKHGDLSSKEISPESAKFVKTVLHFNADIVFISLDSDELTLRTALEIVHQIRDPHIKIVPCMHSDEGLTQIVRGIPPESILLANLYPEGVFKRDFEPEFLTGTHDTMGMAVHEAYIEFGKLKGDSIDTNPSMVSWMELSEEMREFNRRHVEDIPKRAQVLEGRLGNERMEEGAKV
ncbi:MAG: NAD-binding protein [Candidatus Sumerlaeota bacterium]|nr:NAD-binding protein [Candidatus Sumerlaeota bacterium]